MPRKQTPAQARKAAAESDFTPLYAVAGLTDALAEVPGALWPTPRRRAGSGSTRSRAGRPSCRSRPRTAPMSCARS